MGRSGSKVPPPPDMTAEERGFLREQSLSLQEMRRMLGQSELERKETQDIFKNLSGLYSEVETPELRKPGGTTVAPNRDAFNSAIGAWQRTSNSRNPTALPPALEAEVLKRLPVGRGGTRMDTPGGRQTAVQQLIRDVDKSPDLLTSMGFTTSTTLPDEVTPGKKELKVNQDAVNKLRGRLDSYLDAEDKLSLEEQTRQGEAQKLAENANKKLLERLIQGPSADEQAYLDAQNRIGLLQAQRQEKALKGELPVSEATQQRKMRDFALLRENLARRGNQIEGDGPAGAVGHSTAANEALGEFNRTYGLLEDSERRGEISEGAGINLSRYGLGSQIDNQGFNQLQSLRNTGRNPMAPGGQALGFAGQAYGMSPASLLPSYGGLLQSYGAAMQPYQQQRGLQYQSMLQNAALQSQGNSALTSLLGYGGGAALMGGHPLLGGGMLGAGALYGLLS